MLLTRCQFADYKPTLALTKPVWADNAFGTTLAQNGYTARAVYLRGHGQTGGSRQWDKAAEDLQRAWAYLAEQAEVDETRTAVVGASIGANMALVTAAAEPAIDAVVLLSPGLDYQGVTTEDKITDLILDWLNQHLKGN